MVSILFETENLVLGARSEMIGFAIGQVCSWFQVSARLSAAKATGLITKKSCHFGVVSYEVSVKKSNPEF